MFVSGIGLAVISLVTLPSPVRVPKTDHTALARTTFKFVFTDPVCCNRSNAINSAVSHQRRVLKGETPKEKKTGKMQFLSVFQILKPLISLTKNKLAKYIFCQLSKFKNNLYVVFAIYEVAFGILKRNRLLF